MNNVQVVLPPEGSDCTNNLSQWYHCSNNKGIPDDVLSTAWAQSSAVSFVFHHRSAKQEIVLDPKVVEKKKKKTFVDEDEDCDFSEPDDGNDSDYE